MVAPPINVRLLIRRYRGTNEPRFTLTKELRAWCRVSGILGAVLTIWAVYLRGRETVPHHRAGLQVAGIIGIGLLALVLVAVRWRRTIGVLLEEASVPGDARSAARTRLTLFSRRVQGNRKRPLPVIRGFEAAE